MFNEMSEVLSGAIAFEWSMEASPTGYGVALTPGFIAGQPELRLLDTYYALQKQFRGNEVSGRWNGAEIANCAWQPSNAAPLTLRKEPATCPSQGVAAALQQQRGVDRVADWQVLPAPPKMDDPSLATCPAFSVPLVLLQEARCHVP
mmetsp:Transcript_40370/g.104472  ORF Transcript_40370/g.104472 Transcript_40370/m.104472 type:complete len:147 (+) Transcript_40370:990-1430(+)